ncbi:mitochondrial nucleoid-associated protein 1 isoform X2 [Pyxicephalus adspersus]
METCPFCGKSFKRLKSHLPHCKMARAKNDSSATEQATKSTKAGRKKASSVEAKEKNVKNEGDDHMKVTKKTQANKKTSNGTQKTRLEVKEKKDLKKDKQNGEVDQAHGKNRFIEKEGPTMIAWLGPTHLTMLKSPEVATPLVKPGPVHVPVTQPRSNLKPSAHQALAGSSESLKTSEDLTRPTQIEDDRGVIEETGSAYVKEVSQITKDRTQQEDNWSFGEDLEGSLMEKPSQKPNHQHTLLPSDPHSSFLLSTKTSSLDNQFSSHSQLPNQSRKLQTSDVHALKTTKTSFEGQLDLNHARNIEDLTWPNQMEDNRGAVEETRSTQTSLHEEVSNVTKDGTHQEDLWSFRDDLKSSLMEKPSQKPNHHHSLLPSDPCSSFLLSTMASSLDEQYSSHSQLPNSSQPPDTNAFKTTKTSFKGQLDLTPAWNIGIFWPVRDASSLGLQWIPELRSNYVQLKIVPEKINLMSFNRRRGPKPEVLGSADSGHYKPAPLPPFPKVPLTSRRLMDVRIGEMLSWLALQRFSMKTIPELGQRAWTQYYNKYINVRKGGIGGIAMILASYCVFSYTWNYHHIRQDRWRKYH